jgi:hypothetical protein
MKSENFSILFCFVLVQALIGFSVASEELTDAEKGRNIFNEAVSAILFGEDPTTAFKDMFVDTSKGVFSLLDEANDMVTIDDMIRIFIQTIMILVSGRRPDIIPKDFDGKIRINKILTE